MQQRLKSPKTLDLTSPRMQLNGIFSLDPLWLVKCFRHYTCLSIKFGGLALC